MNKNKELELVIEKIRELEILKEELILEDLISNIISRLERDSSITEEAEKIIEGERDVDYGDPVENFRRISKIAGILLGEEISPRTCCLILISVKFAREIYKHKRDNLVDIVGYSIILNLIEDSEI